jgi:hypothetical protein
MSNQTILKSRAKHPQKEWPDWAIFQQLGNFSTIGQFFNNWAIFQQLGNSLKVAVIFWKDDLVTFWASFYQGIVLYLRFSKHGLM